MAVVRNSGCWRGAISRITNGQVYVVVERYAAGKEMPVAAVTDQASDTRDTVGGSQVSAIRVGRRVLVVFLEGQGDSPVIIGTVR